MKKNKIITLGLSIILLIGFFSCTEDNLLNLVPFNQLNENTAFESKDNIELALNGVYSSAQLGYYDGGYRGYPFGAAYIQQNDMRGEDLVNIYAFYQYTYTATYDASSTLNNIYYWVDTYRLINQINVFIEGVEKAVELGTITQAEANVYLGQVLFFRGFAHFELLKHFSSPYDHTPASGAPHYGVPYRTVASTSSETALLNAELGRGTVQEAYEKVLQDLNEAESLLESAGSHNIIRVSKYTAIALKTRFYLNTRNWAKVIEEANKLNGVFELEDDPHTPFILASNRNNSESIFSIDNSATNNPGVNAAIASQYNNRELVGISPIIWNHPGWPADDKRREFETAAGANDRFVRIASANNAYLTTKYKDKTTRSDATPLLRYAEVLLNRAEAKARTGDATYLDDLNAVRGRATSQVYEASDLTTPKQRVEAVILEKRIELLGEGVRWGDIHRLQNDDLIDYDGIPAKYANGNIALTDYSIGAGYTIKSSDVQAVPYSDYRFLWPIPTRETSVNPVLDAEQNPGW